MLMESRVDDSHEAANTKKQRSLDLQNLYDQNSGLPVGKKWNKPGTLKRKQGSAGDDSGLARKKVKKEHTLGSVSSGKKTKKCLGEANDGVSSLTSGTLDQSESGPSHKYDERVNGLDGILVSVGNDVSQMPKSKRGLVQRKKVDVSDRLKEEGTSGNKAGSSNLAADLKGVSVGKTGNDGELDGNPDQNGKSEGSFSLEVGKKVKRKKGFNDKKGNSSSKLDLSRPLKKESGNSVDPSSSKKGKVNRKRRKEETENVVAAPVKDAKPTFGQPTRTHESPGDEEENLEANAARMLSSRFDPSCTGALSSNTGSKSPFMPRSRRDDAGGQFESHSDADVASGDEDVRVLRPRDKRKRKGPTRKRRHFYEVLAKDLDAFWMVERKIKVYWPLDQFWYFGEVIGYDSKKMLHHIKYDDHEEEWIDLRNERFKLLLYPSELPFKDGKKGSGAKAEHGMKGRSDAKLQDDCPSISHVDSEPIVSWLAKSAGQIKSSSVGKSKKLKPSDLFGKGRPSSSALAKQATSEFSDIGTLPGSAASADQVLKNVELPDNSCGTEVGRTSLKENSSSSPIVYFRKRFRRKENGRADVSDCRMGCFLKDQLVDSRVLSPDPVDRLGCFSPENLTSCTFSHSVDSLSALHCRSRPSEINDSPPQHLASVDLPRFDDGLENLNLSVPMVNTEVLGYKLNFLPFMVPYYSFGFENLRFIHASLMMKYGTLVTLWPRVHLELLIVDNFVGLRFLLFEGCLVQAIACVFFILNVFHESGQQRNHVDEHLPVTSVRFQFSFLEDLTKQLAFAFYNFCQLDTSRWVFLEHMLQKDCLLAEKLPPSECTYDNIKALENGSNRLNVLPVSPRHSSRSGSRRSTRQRTAVASSCVSHSRSWVDREGKRATLPPFALSFSAAPTFFLSLHLKLLMECSIPCVNLKDHNSVSLPEKGNFCSSLHLRGNNLDDIPTTVVEKLSRLNLETGKNVASASCEVDDVIRKPSPISQVLDDDRLNKAKYNEVNCKRHDSSQRPSSIDRGPSLQGKTSYHPPNGITVEIPLFDPKERSIGGGPKIGQSDRSVCSPMPSASRSSWHPSKAGSFLSGSLSPAVADRKPDRFCSGPKKPRTQVSYTMTPDSHDFSTKLRAHHPKGFSHRRIRRASEKREPDAPGKCQKNMDSSSCAVNVLVITGDRGWREGGARVVLEPVDDSEWRLAVKISGFTRYAYKAHQFLQSGSTNRFTLAMMWKGGKDWILEFPDRSQWTLFKEMHEECYNRNFRAAFVKNIPIPGVRLIEKNDDNQVETPFVRPSSGYFRQFQTDVELAMDPSHVLYDMDSDDESWISKIRSSDVEAYGLQNFPDEMFEKIMDRLEKISYANQQVHFTPDELGIFFTESETLEAIEIVYEHWLEKRQKKGMPLLRHLQPPLWLIYQQQVKEWESAASKSNGAESSGCCEKPPVFAFCLRPRGLDLPSNRVTKQRSQKRLTYLGHGQAISRDSELSHSYGRRLSGRALVEDRLLYHHGSLDSPQALHASTRLLSPRDVGGSGHLNEGYERIHYPGLHRTKSRKTGGLPYPSDQQLHEARRPTSKRNEMQAWNARAPEPSNPRYSQLEGPPRLSLKHLDPADLDEFTLRDAPSVARHARNIARLKRERAQKLLYKADLAIHKATVAMMVAEAIKASRRGLNDDTSSDG